MAVGEDACSSNTLSCLRTSIIALIAFVKDAKKRIHDKAEVVSERKRLK